MFICLPPPPLAPWLWAPPWRWQSCNSSMYLHCICHSLSRGSNHIFLQRRKEEEEGGSKITHPGVCLALSRCLICVYEQYKVLREAHKAFPWGSRVIWLAGLSLLQASLWNSKNDGPGANVISDESIRALYCWKLGRRIKVPFIIYTYTQMGCGKWSPRFIFWCLFLWPWNWLSNDKSFNKARKLGWFRSNPYPSLRARWAVLLNSPPVFQFYAYIIWVTGGRREEAARLGVHLSERAWRKAGSLFHSGSAPVTVTL